MFTLTLLLLTFFAEPSANICLDDTMLVDDDEDTQIFDDDASPDLISTINATGGLDPIDAEDWLSEEFEDEEVQVTIIPPSGWTLSWVRWPSGTGGILPVDQPVEEEEYEFSYRITNGGQSKTGDGYIKIKSGEPPPT